MSGWALSEAEEGRVLRRVALGVGLSLLAHALLISAWRIPVPGPARPSPGPLAVRLQPPPPPPPAPQVETAPPSQPAARPARQVKPKPPRPVIAVDPSPGPAQPDPFTVQQPSAEPDTPRFDPDAARAMARSLANMKDPAKEGTAIGQFPEKPLETESKAARAIGAAKRRNCKDGLPGGLLGPILILADKKDSGCKW